MLRIPKARVITRMMGSPSGTIATKMAMATINCSTATSRRPIVSISGSPYAMRTLIETKSVATIKAINPKKRPRDSNFNSSGVLGDSEPTMLLAIRPSSVDIPVSTTIPIARPVETQVPMYAMLLRSARSVEDGRASVDLSILLDSPVNEDSSTLH